MPDFLRVAADTVAFLMDKGPFALLLLIAVGEIGMPIPVATDGLLLVAGYDGSRVPLVFGMLLLGSLAGASVSYWAVRLGGRPFIRRHGHYVGLTLSRLDGLEMRMQRWGARAVIVGRLTPGLLFVTNAASGLFRIPYATFAVCVVGTAALWGVVVLTAGYALRLGFGATLAAVAREESALWAIPFVLFGLGILVGWLVLRAHLARKKASVSATSPNETPQSPRVDPQ
ncbi:MAG: DedA family protein [Chloroflexota bacterium]